MFQFTRDFIINDNIGHLKEGDTLVRFKTVDCGNNDKCLLIDGTGVNLYKRFVKNVSVHPFHPAVNEKLEIGSLANIVNTLPTDAPLKKGDVIRLVLNLGQEGREISTFNDNAQHHTRQYFYEGTVCKDGELNDAIDEIMRGYKRDLALSDLRYFTMEYDGTKLTITCNDCYTRIFSIRIVRVNKVGDRRMMGESRTGYKDYDVMFLAGRKDRKDYHWETMPGFTGDYEGVKYTFTEGSEGNGTVARLIKNMRVPTFEHMDWFGTMRDELPIPSGEYDQYMIEYVTPKRQIGHQVMGSYNDASLVTFVFFVLKGDVSEAFAGALTKAFGFNTKTDTYAEFAEDNTSVQVNDYLVNDEHPDTHMVNPDIALNRFPEGDHEEMTGKYAQETTELGKAEEASTEDEPVEP